MDQKYSLIQSADSVQIVLTGNREDYREEKYRKDNYRDPDRYHDERAYQPPPTRLGNEGGAEQGAREEVGRAGHPAARAR